MTNEAVRTRAPAAWVGLLEGALALLLAFGIGSLTTERVGLIVAAVAAGFGVLTAYATRDTMLGVIVGLAKAGWPWPSGTAPSSRWSRPARCWLW